MRRPHGFGREALKRGRLPQRLESGKIRDNELLNLRDRFSSDATRVLFRGGGSAVPLRDIDRQLIDRCLGKEPGAWNDFVDRYMGLIYHVIQHVSHARSMVLSRRRHRGHRRRDLSRASSTTITAPSAGSAVPARCRPI